MDSVRVIEFGCGHGDLGGPLASLHHELLPRSPVALLGPRFMADFYYRLLPRLDLIYGAIAVSDDTPIGFVCATHDSDGFMEIAIRKHFARLGVVLARSVIGDWRRAGAIREAIQIMRHRGTEPGRGERCGELLSFGVLEAHRRAVLPSSGRRVSLELFERGMRALVAHRASVVRVLVDRDNTHARLFYGGLGWQCVRTDVPGWRTPQVEFQWRSSPGEGERGDSAA